MMRRKILLLLAATLSSSVAPGSLVPSFAQPLPLLHLEDLEYAGAFRVPDDTFGDSDLNYSEGPLAYHPGRHSIYIVGHSHHQAVAELAIPALTESLVLDDLQMSGAPLQWFSSVLDRAAGGNPEDLNRIGGMALVATPGGVELLVNAYEYYDAPADNSQTTLVLRDADDLAASPVDGFFELEGGAGHASGWISPVPSGWQAALGGSHIAGHSSGIPIISRTSVGPSAFAFDPLAIAGVAAGQVPNPVPDVTLLDFDLDHPLHSDLSNTSLDNDLWTHLSRAVYGLVVPGTRTYLTLGHSGGHESGVCYKCTQDDGNLCGGYCAPDADDYYLYYWLWDVDDLLEVKSGAQDPHEPRPYEYGVFPAPFPTTELGGGAFDPASGLLYLTLQRADTEQGTYSNPPVVVAFRFDVAGLFEDGFESGDGGAWGTQSPP